MTLKTGKTAPKYNLRSVKSAIALALAFNDLPDPPDNSEDWVKAVLAQAQEAQEAQEGEQAVASSC